MEPKKLLIHIAIVIIASAAAAASGIAVMAIAAAASGIAVAAGDYRQPSKPFLQFDADRYAHACHIEAFNARGFKQAFADTDDGRLGTDEFVEAESHGLVRQPGIDR